MQSLLQTSSRIASRSTGTHQSCRKSRMSRGSMRVYVAGNGTLPVDLNRSSICTVRSFLLVPTLPLFFLGVTSQSTVCAKMYLIGVCSTMQHSCTDAPRHPQTTFLSFHIWSTPSPCVAREIRCAGGRRKEAQARAHTNAPIRCSGGGNFHSFIIRYLFAQLPHDSAHSNYGPEFVNPAALL
jgi:hypothetical protein